MYKNSLLALLAIACSSFVLVNASPQNTSIVFKVSNVKSHEVLNVRAKPSSYSNILLQLPSDSRWILKKSGLKKGNWQKVVWGKKEGWVHTNYISVDSEGSTFLKNHRQCMRDHPSQSICCGYISHGRNTTEIKTYKVVHVAKGQSLNVRSAASAKAKKVATIPHNAVGIVKHPRGRMNVGRSTWQKIRWNGHDGWVNSYFINYDPVTSSYRNFVQKTCENSPVSSH